MALVLENEDSERFSLSDTLHLHLQLDGGRTHNTKSVQCFLQYMPQHNATYQFSCRFLSYPRLDAGIRNDTIMSTIYDLTGSFSLQTLSWRDNKRLKSLRNWTHYPLHRLKKPWRNDTEYSSSPAPPTPTEPPPHPTEEATPSPPPPSSIRPSTTNNTSHGLVSPYLPTLPSLPRAPGRPPS